jgi:hypothetical protein
MVSKFNLSLVLKTLFVFSFISLAIVFLSSCGSDEQGVSPVDKNAVPEIPKQFPLTGEYGAFTNQPAIAVKIPSDYNAHPYVGINDADIVWQEVLEGRTPRLMAIFQTKVPAKVMPIRSIRMMDGPILSQLKGSVVSSSGGHAPFYNRVKTSGVQPIVADKGSMCFGRDRTRYSPNNMYCDMKVALSQLDATHSKWTGTPYFKYADITDTTSAEKFGKDSTAFKTTTNGKYFYISWTYKDGKYYINEDGKYSVDSTKSPMTTENVVRINLKMKNTKFKDPAGNYEWEDDVIGSGTGKAHSNGKVVNIKWSKSADTAPFKFTLKDDDSELILAPGRTWVIIQLTN